MMSSCVAVTANAVTGWNSDKAFATETVAVDGKTEQRLIPPDDNHQQIATAGVVVDARPSLVAPDSDPRSY